MVSNTKKGAADMHSALRDSATTANKQLDTYENEIMELLRPDDADSDRMPASFLDPTSGADSYST